MKMKSRILMLMILVSMLCLTLLGALNMDRRPKEEEVLPDEEVIEEEDDNVVPATFRGKVEDEFAVPQDIMKLITDYMDAYYRSLYTLEVADLSDLFSDPLMEKISERAITLVVEAHKDHDFDFTMKKAHYDLGVTDYRVENDKYYVDLLEDDTMCFSFLNGIESKTYEIENYFTIVKTDQGYKIEDLDKIQGYYMTFHDEAKSIDDVENTYAYYSGQLKDMFTYNKEILLPKSKEKAYIPNKTFAKAYDRNKAAAYADRYHHDRNPLWYNFTDEGGNCQNYASQCMLEGGIPLDYFGEEQWKCYVEDPDYEPEINEEDTPNGRTRSWVNVNYFYNYAKWNEGKGLVADANVNLYYAEPGDIIIVGNGGLSHTVIVSKIVDGHILVDSNSIDMKDYPVEAYTYTTIMLIKILGSN
ncbi:MAG: amidase domain-containing protein [Erysipelotrichaceae bacterium]|nr:amidase domain-containing protein [Erysipelotrichaceae bacterium]